MTGLGLLSRRSYAGSEYGARASAYGYGKGATATSTSPSGPTSARNIRDGVVPACLRPLEGGSDPSTSASPQGSRATRAPRLPASGRRIPRQGILHPPLSRSASTDTGSVATTAPNSAPARAESWPQNRHYWQASGARSISRNCLANRPGSRAPCKGRSLLPPPGKKR